MKTLYKVSLLVALLLSSTLIPGQTSADNSNVINFNVRTYDDKELPAQIISPENSDKKLLLFINGSTPYDEKGHIGPNWTDGGDIIAFKHEFYIRFLNVMADKGYPVATMAKEASFIQPKYLVLVLLTWLWISITLFLNLREKAISMMKRTL